MVVLLQILQTIKVNDQTDEEIKTATTMILRMTPKKKKAKAASLKTISQTKTLMEKKTTMKAKTPKAKLHLTMRQINRPEIQIPAAQMRQKTKTARKQKQKAKTENHLTLRIQKAILKTQKAILKTRKMIKKTKTDLTETNQKQQNLVTMKPILTKKKTMRAMMIPKTMMIQIQHLVSQR